jgi:DNA-binding HxlR family transcriptional regulator
LNQVDFERRMQMEKTDFSSSPCSVARALDRVGSWWTMLILRDCFYGMTRFDEFQKSLNVSTNSLTTRLNALVEEGLLERRQYSERPPRYEYILTPRGHEFRPVLLALFDWGRKHFSPEGPAVVLKDAKTGKDVQLQLIDAVTGEPITEERHRYYPGPTATERIRERLERARSSERGQEQD